MQWLFYYTHYSLNQLNKTLTSFKKSASRMEEIMAEGGQMDSLIRSSNHTMTNIAEITDSIKAADLGASMRKLETSLSHMNSILASIDAGEGSLGKLVNDEALYQNLTEASRELEELLREIKEHPMHVLYLRQTYITCTPVYDVALRVNLHVCSPVVMHINRKIY